MLLTVLAHCVPAAVAVAITAIVASAEGAVVASLAGAGLAVGLGLPLAIAFMVLGRRLPPRTAIGLVMAGFLARLAIIGVAAMVAVAAFEKALYAPLLLTVAGTLLVAIISAAATEWRAVLPSQEPAGA